MPVAGDKVTIENGKNVVLDVSPPALDGLTINGKLSFANNRDLELTTEWIMLHGELEIGTEKAPHTRKATITFTNNVKDEDISGIGGTTDRVDRGIMLMGGTLNLHGDRKHTWTKLAQTAAAGSTSIQVLDASGWRVGDEIVLASTDFDPRQAERRTIAAISGNRITLDRKIEYMHFGEITFGVDERGEVESAVMRQSVSPRYDSIALNAARNWRYQPAMLNGEQETPPVKTGATGTGTLTVDRITRAADGSITLDGMSVTAAHIHLGDPGVAGGIEQPGATSQRRPPVAASARRSSACAPSRSPARSRQ